jgi:DNA-binding response OmpR family regulator
VKIEWRLEMGYKILIADDEAEIRSLLKLYLENDGYSVVEAEDGIKALEMVTSEKPDLCVLDIMMPGMDGYQVLRKIREDNNIPVIILSAKDADSEKILGLNLGADDYIAKPFNALEAVARINSNIRRFYSLGSSEVKLESLKVRDLELDQESCTLKKNGVPIELTSVEYKIMELFMTHPGKVFTKQQIYENGWGEDYFIADNNIMVCISKLRSKLSDDPSEYIKTLRGLGYRLEK